MHAGTPANEKKRESAGTDSSEATRTEEAPGTDIDSMHDEESDMSNRRIFFNIPLPDSAKDENGYNKAKFGRNKVRTAKYTPLSFLPKNLWNQFHDNIANIYFLFLIILTVSI